MASAQPLSLGALKRMGYICAGSEGLPEPLSANFLSLLHPQWLSHWWEEVSVLYSVSEPGIQSSLVPSRSGQAGETTGLRAAVTQSIFTSDCWCDSGGQACIMGDSNRNITAPTPLAGCLQALPSSLTGLEIATEVCTQRSRVTCLSYTHHCSRGPHV